MPSTIFRFTVLLACVWCSFNSSAEGIWRAAEAGDITSVKELIELGVPINSPHPESGFSPLISAVYGKQIDTVKYLVEAKADLNAVSSRGRTALYYAVRAEQIAIVKYLLDSGADIDLIGEAGHPPLTEAIVKADKSIARLLIRRMADLDASSNQGWTPAHEAAFRDNPAGLKILIESGAKIDSRTRFGETPLMIAAGQDSLKSTRALLDAGASPSETNGDYTAVGMAAKRGHSDMVLLLAKAGADLSADPMHGELPIFYAAVNGDVKLAEKLIELGSPVPRYESGVFEAIEAGQGEAAVLLMEHGARLYTSQWKKAYPLVQGQSDLNCFKMLVRLSRYDHSIPRDSLNTQKIELPVLKDAEANLLEAAYHGNLERLRTALLGIQESADKDFFLEAAYSFAVSEGRIDAARQLKRQADDIKQQLVRQKWTNDGLFRAANIGDAALAERHITNGADVKKWNFEDNPTSPMAMAIFRGHMDVVEVLLKHGAPVDILPGRRKSPLDEAVDWGKVDIVRLLLEKGANIEKTSHVMYRGASSGNAELVQILLELRAPLNSREPSTGSTALIKAASKGYTDIVILLVEAGADTELKNINGLTAIEAAFSANHGKAMAVLSQNAKLPKNLDKIVARINSNDVIKPQRLKQLLEAGADPNAVLVGTDKLPLGYLFGGGGSINEDRLASARLLIEFGADPNQPPGMLARLPGERFAGETLKAVRLLIEAGADINAVYPRAARRMPPILWAASELSPTYFDLLLKAGADPSVRDERGSDAFDLIQTSRNGRDDEKREMAEHVRNRIVEWKAAQELVDGIEEKP